jgi:hypothetical protein
VPEAVKSLAVQLPVVLAPGFRAAEVSTRVLKDQFNQLILF